MDKEPHADTPVILTLAGADAAKVGPMVRALVQIGDLAATAPVDMFAWRLGNIVGIAIQTLKAVGETAAAEHLHAVFAAQRPTPLEAGQAFFPPAT